MTVTVRTVPAPASLRTVAERVERRLHEVLAAETERWRAFDRDLEAPLAALARLVLDGGKRLRPAFCHWGNIAAGGTGDDPAVVEAGAAFEFLQAFALVHDDVMDGSAVRRGSRTAHLQFADRHAGKRWLGEARRFGEGVAILIGDLAHVYADQLMPTQPPAVLAIWHELRLELNMGQYLDVLGTARADRDQDQSRRIARYKSGKYTIERPLHVGAALAGRIDEMAGLLSAYGDPLGEAFQLRDDMLGAFGDESVTGKPVGDDLREGKPTVLLAVATERADRAGARLLRRVGSVDLTADEIRAVQQLFVETGAVSEVESMIGSLARRAVAATEDARVPGVARAALVELADYVAWRER
ncbi:MAG: polyprenyl synthetase family protein [Acidimicrobiales bacterium]